MSETEDDDGGIDKEALREELREKYGEDNAEREATQRMSDLLLKGATMTNSHCNTCGDPLFRQNGTTFCPTCHGGPGGVEGAPVNGSTEQGPAGGSSAENGADASSAVARSDGDVGAADATNAGASGPKQTASGPTDTPPDPRRGVETHSFEPGASPTNPDGVDTPDPSELAGHDSGSDGASGSPDRRRPSRPAAGELDGAADSLRTALERFAREAATADDPRYARDCLEAAHEAADALAALRQ
ncbi:Sjogren's syndrome/scleroderma autoantigen 1 family protein [Halovivax cerinus]|uniref:Sjogren's syndrome/scleroderma autoantigen 1 family protein n=1 Tax=Halovivax cerinus TaxID=1487865 RepID=A0ABD5NSI0_9EURY|nr:Sjogren's syndrome/scleroderma autoantigen 1 family protein [Halovivax cerinus]